MSNNDTIRCPKNAADVEVDKNNALYPVRFWAKTVDGDTVEIFFSPADADHLGHRFSRAAAKALEFWKPRV